MYKVRITYNFKSDIMYSWFYHSLLYHVEGKLYEKKIDISKLSKAKQKFYHRLYDLVMTDIEYVIRQGWAKYKIDPKKKGGLFILDIDYPESEKELYDGANKLDLIYRGYMKMLSPFFTIKIELGDNIGKGI